MFSKRPSDEEELQFFTAGLVDSRLKVDLSALVILMVDAHPLAP